MKLYTPVLYQVIEMNQASTPFSLPASYSGFIYIFKGKLSFEGRFIYPGEGLHLGQGEKHSLHSQEASGFILAAGKPQEEAIRLNGSFVD